MIRQHNTAGLIRPDRTAFHAEGSAVCKFNTGTRIQAYVSPFQDQFSGSGNRYTVNTVGADASSGKQFGTAVFGNGNTCPVRFNHPAFCGKGAGSPDHDTVASMIAYGSAFQDDRTLRQDSNAGPVGSCVPGNAAAFCGKASSFFDMDTGSVRRAVGYGIVHNGTAVHHTTASRNNADASCGIPADDDIVGCQAPLYEDASSLRAGNYALISGVLIDNGQGCPLFYNDGVIPAIEFSDTAAVQADRDLHAFGNGERLVREHADQVA